MIQTKLEGNEYGNFVFNTLANVSIIACDISSIDSNDNYLFSLQLNVTQAKLKEFKPKITVNMWGNVYITRK